MRYKVYAMYFSPTGGTEKVAMNIATSVNEVIGDGEVQKIDFTLPESRTQDYFFDQDSVVIFATPVYAGRIPNKLLPFIKEKIRAKGALCVCIAVFGNRAFDDALLEQALIMHANGFKVIGGAAAVAEHSMDARMGYGRPDSEDLREGQLFGRHIAESILTEACKERCVIEDIPGDFNLAAYFKPLDMDGKPAVFIRTTPKVDESRCIKCGICETVCPMGSVHLDPFPQMKSPCIKCHACLKKCPQGAIYFDDPVMASHVEMVATVLAADRKDNQWYL